MACLYRRSNGIYYFCTWENGKRVYKSTGKRRRSAALEALRKLDRSPKNGQLSLSDFFAQFLKYAEATYASRNVEIYRRVFKHVGDFFGQKNLAELSVLDLENFKVHRLQRVSASTVNIDFRTLKAAFNRAVDWDLLDSNPCAKVSSIRSVSSRPVFLTQMEFSELYNQVKEKWLRDVILVAVLTGLRQGEIINLRWRDVNFSGAYVHVRNSSTFHTKTGKERTVPLNPGALNLLRSLSQDCEYVFTYPNGQQIRRDHLTHLFKRYIRKSGCDPLIHFHSLRHTFASWLVQTGVPLYYIQKLLGHSSIRVTEIYSHLTDQNLRDSVNKLPDFDTKLEGSPVN